MKIVLCTEYGSNYAQIAGITVPIMRRYAERHGYDFRILVLEGTGNEYYYKKNDFFRELFKEDIDAIAYFDVDIVLTNHTIKLESFIDDRYDLFITELVGEINGGALVIKNSDGGVWVNDFILDKKNDFQNEQNVINVFKEEDGFAAHMKILPHPAFNSIDCSLYPELKESIGDESVGDWKEGHFCCHFPGLGVSDRLELCKEFSQKIIE